MKNLLLLFVISCILGCKTNTHDNLIQDKPNLGLIADKAMVVSAREEASQIGIDIIKSGGNAFDAMIATEMALAVTFPFAGNLGGGGFMVYRLADGSKGALDFREKAPFLASENMYLDEKGDVIPDLSFTGSLAVGVPGTVAGIFSVYEKYGSMTLEEILEPVIVLAEKGYIVTDDQARRFADYKARFLEVNGEEHLYTKDYKGGDRIKNLALANTLERIVENGLSEFYGDGVTAQVLVDFLTYHGGIITKEDLMSYESQWRTPIEFKYDDLNIISMSPPSSGGVALAQIMRSIEPFDLDMFGHNSLKSIQVITEAERRAYADRSHYLGDPDFVNVPVKSLLDKEYINDRMNDFTFESATPSSTLSYGNPDVPKESMETTHYSIVDNEGNSVAVTTTLNGAYGSKLYIDSLGFFLNNEMDDFSAKPGVPNAYGLVGAEANAISPGKRMLSSMTPTIIEKDGELFMVVGTPGGSTIITSVLQTILNVHEYDMTMQDAVDAPRFHHQWLPDHLMVEPKGFDQELLSALSDIGYEINSKDAPVLGKVDAILVLPDGRLEGGADRRGDDSAKGF